MESIQELFCALESNQPSKVEDAKKWFHECFKTVKDPWLMYGTLDYYMSTSSLRIVDVIVGAREPHEQFLFERLSETLKSNQKIQSLALLGHIVTRHPTWLYRIARHNLMKDLFKILKNETEIIPLMSALLTVIILLPIVAGLIGPHLQDIFDVFSRLAAWNTNNPNRLPSGQLLHLQIGLYALFNRLYGMYPWSLLNHLRQHYTLNDNSTIFNHTIKPMLETVKMHPLLVTTISKEMETSTSRWKKMEANDVIIECAKFTIDFCDSVRDETNFRTRTASLRSRSSLEYSTTSSFGEVKSNSIGGRSIQLADGEETWSPSVFCGGHTPPGSAPTSIPHTPISQVPYVLSSTLPQQEGTSPPEAAVEATPESTPVRDVRMSGRERPLGSAVCNLSGSMIGGSQPSSPMRKDSAFFKYPSSSPLPDVRNNIHASAKVHKMCFERTQEGRGGGSSSPQRIPLEERLKEQLLGFTDSELEDREVEDTLSQHCSSTGLGASASTPLSHQGEGMSGWGSEWLAKPLDGQMADSSSMVWFTKRLRYYSQCLPDRNPLAPVLSGGGSPLEGIQLADVNIRRAVSCPEMKKAQSVPSDTSCTVLAETDEEEAVSFNGYSQVKEYEKEDGNLLKTMADSMVQTDDFYQVPGYEHLFMSALSMSDQPLHSAPPDVTCPPMYPGDKFSPYTALENYIEAATKGPSRTSELCDLKTCKEHVSLLKLQLQFERHRREVHAERNRRLLGKFKTNSALEEHNNALKDQVVLLQKDIENLRSELERCKQESKFTLDKVHQSVLQWQDKSYKLDKDNREYLNKINLKNEELKEQKSQYDSLNKECNESRARVFELENTLRSAVAATAGRGIQEKISVLQQRLLFAGETETRLKSSLEKTYTSALRNHAEAEIASASYKNQVQILQLSLDEKAVSLEAALAKIEEIHEELAKKDSIINKQKKLLETLKSDYHLQLKACEGKCAELRRLNLKQEEVMLELRLKVESLEVSGKKGQPPSPPLSASLSSSGTLSLSGAEPAPIKNLQQLVDSSEMGMQSREAPTLLTPPSCPPVQPYTPKTDHFSN